MHVLALGVGAIGRIAALTAARLPGVTALTVADRDRSAADRLADEIGRAAPALRPTVRALTVDVTDPGRLVEVVTAADVVMNTVGPFFRFGPAVLSAAIATRTHYVDVCDDPAPTASLLGLDAEAREAGITAVVGVGASPGVSNLLAAAAVARLDTVRDLYTAWPVDVGPMAGSDDTTTGPDGAPGAAAVHWMEQLHGRVPGVVDGRETTVRPLTPVSLSLPGGRRGHGYVVGHPEPVTLHRSFAVTGSVACLMIVKRSTAAYLDTLRRDMDAGTLDTTAAARLVDEESWRRVLRALGRIHRFPGPGSLPGMFAGATGTRGGRSHSVLAEVDGYDMSSMAVATGVPLAVGVGQVIDGVATRPGVHAPEAVLDATRFFVALTRRHDAVVLAEEEVAA
jgi:saccharopine dehydrogenase-like NADP-dependent oxidoreductase